MTRELTGRHVLMIALGAFGVIIAANLTMLFSATGTFPGLVVKNAYVASQGWNERVAAQEALGWEARVSFGDGTLLVALEDRDGAPVRDAGLRAMAGRTTTDMADRAVTLVWNGHAYEGAADLAAGVWRIDLTAGETFRKSATLVVPEGT